MTPDYQYPKYANQLEDIDRANYDYWNKWYRQFNPQMPVAQSASAAPAYAQRAQGTSDYANSLRAAGPSGGVDFSGLSRNLGNQGALLAGKTDVTNFLNDFEENKQRQQGGQVDAFGRSNDINTMARRMQRLPLDRFAQQLQLGDNSMAAWEQFRQNQQDPLEILAKKGLGILGGGLGGGL